MTTVSFQRYYYAKSQENRRTEQSLDVYEAVPQDGSSSTNSNTTTTKGRPTIVLVMGSGWLGHVPWIYMGTNWWNASGPQTIAKLGYTCISVRHRGGFFQIPSPMSSRNIAIVTSCLLVVILSYLYRPSADMQPQERILEDISKPLAVVGLFVLTWIVLHWQSQGAADLSDMVQDVDEALFYIQNELHETHVILGGYSSGGHVVATWLSSPPQPQDEGDSSSQTKPQLPPMIQGILYLSAVLSLDSAIMNVVTLSVFGKWAREVPSPYTNRSDDAIQLSPMPFSSLPHLIVGCRQETFGLPVLDATFCYQAYTDTLNCRRKKCVLIESNHWSILNSQALSQALQDQLPWLIHASAEATVTPVHLSSDRLPTKTTTTASTMTLSTSTSSGTSTMDTDDSAHRHKSPRGWRT